MAKKRTTTKRANAKRPGARKTGPAARRANGSRKRPSRTRRGAAPNGTRSGGMAAFAAAPVVAAAGEVIVDFTPRPTDIDVTVKSDSALGQQVRLTAEAGNGAWVFEASNGNGARARYLRTVART